MNAPRKDLALPDRLRHQLEGLRRALWRVHGVAAISRAIVLIAAGFLAVFAGDRLVDLSPGVRALLLASVLLGLVFAAWRWLLRGVIPHRTDAGLGRFLKTVNARQADAVMAALDLASPGDPESGAGGSEPLRAAAMQQTARMLGGEDLQATVPREGGRRAARWAAATGVGALAVGLLFPAASLNAWKRLVLPWKDIPRHTFARFVPGPAVRVVALNEPFVLEARLDALSPWHPRVAEAVLPGGTRVAAPRAGDRYRFAMPPLRDPTSLRLSAGDARTRMTVTPLARPGLIDLEVEARLPDYLQLPPRTLDARSGRLTILRGSRLVLKGRASRPLREIQVLADAAPRLTEMPNGAFQSEAFAMESPRLLELSWTDAHGLSNRDPFRLALTPSEDAPPAASWHDPGNSSATMLVDEAVSLALAAEDDYGLRETGYVWTENGVAPEAVWETRNQTCALGDPERRTLVTEAAFSPQSLGLGAGRYRLWAYAIDYFPDREPHFSAPLDLQVLDHAQHAAMVRADFEEVRRELEEVARREKDLLRMNEALLSGVEAEGQEAEETLERRARDERENAAALTRLRDEARRHFAEALKNRELDDAALEPWSRMASGMTAAAEAHMPAAANALAEAAAQAGAAAGSQGGGKAALQEALRHQEAAMETLAGALGDASETAGLLEAATFVNRLRRAAAEERSVAERSRRHLVNTVGLAPAELDASATQALNDMGALQESAILTVDEIHHDLEHYAGRTGRVPHRRVARAMAEAAIGSSLRALLDHVADNQAAHLGREAFRWAEQLDSWAEALAPGDDGDDGSGSSGGAAAVNADLLLALMRLLQTQTDLRERTRHAEVARPANPRHAEDAGVLAADQLAVGLDAARLLASVFDPLTQEKLQNAGRAVSDAVVLLQRSQTGGETIAAQTEVIEWLGQAGESSKGGGAPESKGAEAMLEMMGAMQVGPSAGGNPMGRDSSLASRRLAGEADDSLLEARRGEGASSRAGADLPEEFRDAIDAYFRRVDALEARLGRSLSSPAPVP